VEDEVEQLRKDRKRWKALVSELLKHGENGLPFRDFGYLESLNDRSWQDELSEKQAKWLLDICGKVEAVSSYAGVSVRQLIERCYQAIQLSDSDEDSWLLRLYESGNTYVRRWEAQDLAEMMRRLRTHEI
jgi:hypothetical protein